MSKPTSPRPGQEPRYDGGDNPRPYVPVPNAEPPSKQPPAPAPDKK